MSSIAYSIGNGTSTKFWLDEWVNDLGPLIDYISNPSLISNLNVTVAEFFSQGIDRLRSFVPCEIFLQVEAHGAPASGAP